MRNWVFQNVPTSDTLVGYDLFVKLGNDIAAGVPMNEQTIAAGLPYPDQDVLAHLERMVQAGLVAFVPGGPPREVQPSARFVALLEQYSRQFDVQFIVREELRRRQLLAVASDPELNSFAKIIYDRIYDLGWLYLHNFGSFCFLMASLVRRIVAAHGRQARVASCYVDVAGPTGSLFMLGAAGSAQPGQIDGHAACIVDERLVLDFGLGNLRKGYRRNFPWGIVCDYVRNGGAFGAVVIPGAETVTWKDDWQSPSGDKELEHCARLAETLFADYAARFL